MKKFLFYITLCIGISAQGQDTNFVKIDTWSFDNFTRDATLIDWEMFRQNFIGIPPNKWESNPFEQIMFEEVYKKILYPEGHCFGMDLMALQLLRYGGYGGFCAPAFIHEGIPDDGPVDSDLEFAIQMQHGRQLGFRFMSHILDIIAQSKNRDGNFVYSQFLYYESKKEPTIISITKGITPTDGGHALVPYFAEDLGATKRIYVYDVNRVFRYAADPAVLPLAHYEWYIQRQNFIEINSSNGHWRYFMSDSSMPPSGDLWEGDPASGGSLIVLPFSIMRTKDRMPQSLFADAAEALGKIFIFGNDVQLTQIKTPDGRYFFQKKSITEKNVKPNTSLNSIYPFIPISGGKPLKNDTRLFFIRGEHDFDLEAKGGKEGFKIQLFSDLNSITITSEKPYENIEIKISDFHSKNPKVDSSSNELSIEIEAMGNVEN